MDQAAKYFGASGAIIGAVIGVTCGFFVGGIGGAIGCGAVGASIGWLLGDKAAGMGPAILAATPFIIIGAIILGLVALSKALWGVGKH